MTWTTPRTWTDEELVTANLMNTHIRDNLSYLFSGRPLDAAFDTGEFSTTSTSYVDVDATSLAISITPSSTRVLVLGELSLYAVSSGSNIGYAQIYGDNGAGASDVISIPDGQNSQASLGYLFTGLTPGTTYTFTWQVKATNANVYANRTTRMPDSWLVGVEL